MAVRAIQHVKRMRGGANAHLMAADDGRYYVVKFRDNPQHPRILANELVCYVLLEHLGLPTPGWALVDVGPELIAASPGLVHDFGAEERPCEPGLHFGSRYPADPSRQAVYDYVPLSMLRLAANREAFLGMAAFDKWVSNADGRQAIFFRAKAGDWLPPERLAPAAASAAGPRSLVYVVNMIDHGFAFNAKHWSFSDHPEQGLYARREVYENVRGYDSFEPWLSRILDLPPDVLDDAYKRVPPQWYDRRWDELEALLETLYKRRARTPELLRLGKSAERDPFPNWPLAATARRGR